MATLNEYSNIKPKSKDNNKHMSEEEKTENQEVKDQEIDEIDDWIIEDLIQTYG
mgnify:CR=1 FL=1